MNSTPVQSVASLLHAGGDRQAAYAILDGARDRAIETIVRRSGLPYACLYSGELTPRMRAAAPYLVRLDPDAPASHELLREAWGESWGIFAIVPEDLQLADLRRHLRRFLRVQDENGKYLVFRYYDPRVLRAYLPTCTAEEAETLFGPVERFVAEAEDPASALTFDRDPGGEVRVDSVPITVDQPFSV